MHPDDVTASTEPLHLLDVRDGWEWDAGHIEGATHIPMQELGARLDELPRDAHIVTVCRSGARSGQVAAAMANAGFQVDNLDGGLQAWAAAGKDLVASDGGPGQVA